MSTQKTKTPLIIISVIIAVLLIAVIVLAVFLAQVNAVRFDHVENSGRYAANAYNLSAEEAQAQGYSVKTPFFGNSLMIAGGTYTVYFMNAGAENIAVYDAVNSPIDMWANYAVARYDNRVKADYDIVQDDKTIEVTMNGTADVEGKTVDISEKFVFNIENASPENLPQWTNRDELSSEYKEYLDYVDDCINNPEKAVMPDWLSASHAA